MSGGGGGGPTLDTQASGAPTAAPRAPAAGKVSRGYAEELEHWAWCIRHPRPGEPAPLRPEGGPGRRRDRPDGQHGRPARHARIEFKKEWFDIHSDETPEDVKPARASRRAVETTRVGRKWADGVAVSQIATASQLQHATTRIADVS